MAALPKITKNTTFKAEKVIRLVNEETGDVYQYKDVVKVTFKNHKIYLHRTNFQDCVVSKVNHEDSYDVYLVQ